MSSLKRSKHLTHEEKMKQYYEKLYEKQEKEKQIRKKNLDKKMKKIN